MSGLAERAAKLSKVREAGTKKAPVLRAKVVSLTVMITEDLYIGLKDFPEKEDLPGRTGRARVPTVEVLRALIEELLSDDELQAKVADRVVDNSK